MLDSEIDFWESYWKCYTGDIPDEARTTMKRISFPGFQNIQMALKILELFQSHLIHVKGHSQQCADSKTTQG